MSGAWTRFRLSGPRQLGFTLLEVVIALLVLEVAVVGAVGILVVASATLSRAERLERVAALAEGVLDSLTAAPSATTGSLTDAVAVLEWTVDSAGSVTLTAFDRTGADLFEVQAVLPPGTDAP